MAYAFTVQDLRTQINGAPALFLRVTETDIQLASEWSYLGGLMLPYCRLVSVCCQITSAPTTTVTPVFGRQPGFVVPSTDLIAAYEESGFINDVPNVWVRRSGGIYGRSTPDIATGSVVTELLLVESPG